MLSSPPGETGTRDGSWDGSTDRGLPASAGALWGGCAHAPGLGALLWGQGPAAVRLMAKRHWEGTWSRSVLLKLCAWECSHMRTGRSADPG